MIKIHRLVILLVLVGALIGVWAVSYLRLSPLIPVPTSSPLTITTSFYPLYFFASQIGGDKVLVINITPAGSEPHDYELSTQDVIAIQNSRLLLVNGGVEGWSDKIAQDLKGTSTQLVQVSDGLLSQQTVDENGQSIVDPHIWLSPPLAKHMVEKIEVAMATADPLNQDTYFKNANELSKQLDQLDEQYRQGLQTCQQKEIVTSHAAFGYLASTYGLRQISITGISPDAEPSLQALSKLADLATKNRVKYIFFESLVSPKLSETLATEIGAQTLVLDPIEGLSHDDMQQGKTYFTQMYQNLQNLRTALSCQ